MVRGFEIRFYFFISLVEFYKCIFGSNVIDFELFKTVVVIIIQNLFNHLKHSYSLRRLRSTRCCDTDEVGWRRDNPGTLMIELAGKEKQTIL